MLTAISLQDSPENKPLQQGVVFVSLKEDISRIPLQEEDKAFVSERLFTKNKDQASISNSTTQVFFLKQKEHPLPSYQAELARKAGAKAWGFLKELDEQHIYYFGQQREAFLHFVEGCMLGSYKFQKYKSEQKSAPGSLQLWTDALDQASIALLEASVAATFEARNLVNEPTIYLTAVQLAEDIQQLGKKYGFKTETYEENQIASLKMAGLLAVNAGSEVPPTFNILCHQPENAVNEKPIVFVGKGVVYDTGGLSLKPTANSMDLMKSDMAGAATVVGTLCAIAKLNLPIYIIGLIPATDNRPGYNAITPGDVITYPNGKTVEILNTDAEGRLILADALIFAQKYQPELVIDVATLTGSAMAAIGKEGAVLMGTATDEVKSSLQNAGQEVFERLVEFPLWEEYDEQLKSSIADISNLGGPTAGAITAGKFLQHFIDYDWLHLDIAGPAYSKTGEGYKPAGGSGFGVRLLTKFLSNYVKANHEQ